MKNPYEEIVKEQEDFLAKYPETPNLAKLAYYCGCDVETLAEELQKVLRKTNQSLK